MLFLMKLIGNRFFIIESIFVFVPGIKNEIEFCRLFEMGFGEQIHEIVNRLPESRQTLLFSATLPKILVDFAKAGLSDPILLRLDVESKLPEGLTLSFITCRPEEKLAVLLCLLKRIIKPDSQIIIFAETLHHVEYIHQVIT